ncbi:MAG: hypothetical protein H6844_05575 [Alphaproteobacteria bacterium]|nr:hypothetical protein [Alphaproteobacteria bacterium]
MAAVLSPLLLDQPAVPPPTAAPTPSSANAAASAARAEADAEAAVRRQALARVRRGRLGTIATSARGILAPGPSTVERRSLLGG